MYRFQIIAVMLLLALVSSSPAVADDLTAQEIFEGMIYYENDQLVAQPDISDYHCTVTQTVTRAGARITEEMVKDIYFMIPAFQLHFIDGTPAYYFDNDAILVTLESMELDRLRDATNNDVDCYVLMATPTDPAFARFNTTYYVAKDDFRHVMTVKFGSSDQLDTTTTTLNYTYGPAGPFQLTQRILAETFNEEGALIHTVDAVYTDYEFGLGLDIEFFINPIMDGDGTVHPIWN